MDKFSYDYIMNYYALRPDSSVSFPGLVDYLQETSTRHAAAGGRGPEWFAKNRKAWVITHWDINFYNTPKWDDRVTVSTWPSSFKGLIAERSFEARFTDSGAIICTARSNWIYTDLAAKRPARPAKEDIEIYGDFFPPAHERGTSASDMIKSLENMEYKPLSRREMTVTRRDIDTNGHVNNAKYFVWAADDLPEDVYMSEFKNVKAAYKKECKEGDGVVIELAQNAINPNLFMSKISRDKPGEDGKNAVIAEIFMERR